MTTVVLIPIAVAIYSHLSFLLSLLFGFNSFVLALAVPLAIGVLIPVGRVVRSLSRTRSVAHLIGIWVAAFTVLFPLFYTHSFMPTTEGWVSGGGAWGDYAWHSTVIHHFAQRDRISLDHPLLAGEMLTYPFLIDFFSAILLRAGFSIQHALLIPGVLLASNLVALVFVATQQITKNSIVALVTVLLFFFNGGLGWWFAIGDYQRSGQSFVQWITTLNTSYTFNSEHNIHFSNIIADYLIPQRPLLLGLSLGIIVLWLFWEISFHNRKARIYELAFIGFLSGLLPFIHQHTFLALAILLPLLLLLAPLRRSFSEASPLRLLARQRLLESEPRSRRLANIVAIGIPAGILALPQLWWYVSHLSVSQYFKFVVGWMAEGEPLYLFWLKNLGLFLPLSLAATAFAPSKARWFLLPFWLLFVLTNLVQFQPYNYDNMKLMLPWLLAAAVAVAALLYQIARRVPRFLRLPLYATVLFILTASGVLTVIRESHQQWLLYDHEAIALARWVSANTRPDDRFLTSDAHNHPIPGLTGRPIVLGYRGWLWSHGLDYGQQEADLSEMLSFSPQGRNLLKRYGIHYAVIGPSERHLGNELPQVPTDLMVVYQSPRYAVIKAL